MNAITEILTGNHLAALPIRFGGVAALYTPALPLPEQADAAVLLVSPWGFEDMSVRAFYRVMAENLAARGAASLRFDLPGTGDSAEIPEAATLDTWLTAVEAAAAELTRLAGVSNIILAGHGLGATLALLAETRIDNLAGVALLAPVVSGRIYARETALWWKMIAADLGLASGFTETQALTIAGMTMPEEIAGAIRKLRESDLGLTRPLPVLAVCRKGRDGDEALAAKLEQTGAAVTRHPYDGFDALVVNPLISRVPLGVANALAEWVAGVAPKIKSRRAPDLAPSTSLAGEGYRETGLRFAEGTLVGTLCEPLSKPQGAPVLLVSTSYDRASAWANTGARMARALARCGIVTLRFDAAGVADSPPQPNDPQEVLYSAALDRDVKAALEELRTRTGRAPVIAGRCSGGYHAFKAGLEEADVAGIAVINSYAFVWDSRKEVSEALNAVARPLGDYSKRAMNPETFRRILRGEVNLKAASFAIISQIAKRLYNRVEPMLGNLAAGNRLKSDIRAAFQTFADRNVPVLLAYGDNDPGLEQSRMVFGADLSGLKRFENTRYVSLGDADHNVTVPEAQETVIEEIARVALNAGPAGLPSRR